MKTCSSFCEACDKLFSLCLCGGGDKLCCLNSGAARFLEYCMRCGVLNEVIEFLPAIIFHITTPPYPTDIILKAVTGKSSLFLKVL